MDYEKKYKEALERCREFYAKFSNKQIKEEIVEIFPELAESEDEKIRKSLIDMLKNDEKCYLKEIAWLEKQRKHQKFRDSIQVGDKVTRNEDGVLVNLSRLNRVAKKDEKQSEQKPADKVERKGMNITEEDMTPFQKKVFCIIDTTIEQEQGLKQVCDELLRLAHDEIIQTPAAWSEEDEKKLLCICAWIKDYSHIADFKDEIYTVANNYIDWLKSLKDRCLPFPKQEWQEIDEYRRRQINRIVKNSGASAKLQKEIEDWLSTLIPQKHWKPSEGQMVALKCAITTADEKWVCMNTKDLESLYQDLNKTKGGIVMKNISFRFPTSIRDIKVLWKEYTSKRYRKNVKAMREMTDYYITNVLKGRWGEVADGKVVKWSDGDKRQFEEEMWDKCNSYIHDLME